MLFTQLLAPIALIGSVVAAPAPREVSSRGVNPMDLPGFVNDIFDYLEPQERGEWAMNMLQKLKAEHPNTNIFLFRANKGQFHWSTKNEPFFNTEYGMQEIKLGPKIQFRAISFTGEGELENFGDGGWKNWAYSGNCHKDGDKKVKCT